MKEDYKIENQYFQAYMNTKFQFRFYLTFISQIYAGSNNRILDVVQRTKIFLWSPLINFIMMIISWLRQFFTQIPGSTVMAIYFITELLRQRIRIVHPRIELVGGKARDRFEVCSTSAGKNKINPRQNGNESVLMWQSRVQWNAFIAPFL